MNWEAQSHGTGESVMIGPFRVSVYEPMRAKGVPATYRFSVAGYTSNEYTSRDDAKAGAIRWLKMACEKALSALAESEASDV